MYKVFCEGFVGDWYVSVLVLGRAIFGSVSYLDVYLGYAY
jgi:hypothetical protein